MPNLMQSLQGHDVGHLRIIAELCEFELQSAEPKNYLEQLAAKMVNRHNLTKIIEALPQQARLAWNDLINHQGRLPWAQFTRRYGDVREMGPARPDRERPYLTKTSPAEILWYRALIARSFLESQGGPEEYAYIPDDLLSLMATVDQAPHPKLGRPAAVKEIAFNVDRNGKALMNCILWMDMRGAPYLHRQARGLINVAGADAVKVLRWIRLTGGMPSLTGKDPAVHMQLVREEFPDVYARTYKFLNVLDYLNLRLTGRYAATFDSILTSWVTDNRNPNDIRYHNVLIKASGIDADKFPEIVSCTTVLGKVKSEVAEALGLSADVKVVAGAIDNTAAAIGSGAVDDFMPHLYLGTSSWIAAHVPYKKTR